MNEIQWFLLNDNCKLDWELAYLYHRVFNEDFYLLTEYQLWMNSIRSKGCIMVEKELVITLVD